MKSLLEPFILTLLATVALATLLPAQGDVAQICDTASDAAIVLLFFLHGAKLSREAILTGLKAVKLHAAVLTATFVFFPLLGLASAQAPWLTKDIAAGMLFLTLLPSTVQSSIAFTAIARGNVAAAVCSASFSNLLGIFVTPALVALLMGQQGGVSLDSIQKIVLQLLVPFLIGHALRPLIGAKIDANKKLISYVDRGSILLIVYTAFSEAVVQGIWKQVAGIDLVLIGLTCAVLLAVVLSATWYAARPLKLSREDQIVLLFCGSKKSLATGVPMAGVLFPAATIGVVLLPLMLFHQLQLMACALIARRLEAHSSESGTNGVAGNLSASDTAGRSRS